MVATSVGCGNRVVAEMALVSIPITCSSQQLLDCECGDHPAACALDTFSVSVVTFQLHVHLILSVIGVITVSSDVCAHSAIS